MKAFVLKDAADNDRKIAYLIYYETEKRFYLEIADDASYGDLPVSLHIYMRNGNRSLNSQQASDWVSQRIVPSERQNINQFLREMKIREYDDYSFLLMNKGRCSQDDCYLESIDGSFLPDSIQERFVTLIEDFSYLDRSRLLVFFKNGMVKKCDLSDIIKEDRYHGLIYSPERYADLKISGNGHELCFNENLCISHRDLYKKGIALRITGGEYLSSIRSLLVSTAQACEMLSCSRQNISDLVRREKLVPFIRTGKEMLFLKRDVLQRKADH